VESLEITWKVRLEKWSVPTTRQPIHLTQEREKTGANPSSTAMQSNHFKNVSNRDHRD
jgi:hypothetical protein